MAGFYRYAVEGELLDHWPAAHVRRPRLDYESHATGLDRNELGALPRTTMRYDRARTLLDRHATCIVAAHVAGAAR